MKNLIVVVAIALSSAAYAEDVSVLRLTGNLEQVTHMSESEGDELSCVFDAQKATMLVGARKKINGTWPVGFHILIPANTNLNSTFEIKRGDVSYSVGLQTVADGAWYPHSCTVILKNVDRTLTLKLECKDVEDVLSPVNARRKIDVSASLSCSTKHLVW